MTKATKEKIRCVWARDSELYIDYHDHEWGVPLHDDRRLFEMINLEGAQAGLSWITILKKRENYRKAFDNFDAQKVAKYTAAKEEKLLQNEGIIRNRLKVHAFVRNAKAFLEVQKEWETFDAYIWHFADNKPMLRTRRKEAEKISEVMSKDLKKRGFTFVGATICYAFMQAIGMINDHSPECFLAK